MKIYKTVYHVYDEKKKKDKTMFTEDLKKANAFYRKLGKQGCKSRRLWEHVYNSKDLYERGYPWKENIIKSD